ncbi:MAG: T9SS type B sorting domain-containing protein, partial [Bacteroidetes bacterium]|nr:T9SS type B sorting domain-containing protein [Bacteroidota bacterium]
NGCTNSASVTYTVNPTPTANDQTPSVCSDTEEGNTATVDLTTLANAIDGGNGYTINWYSDAGLTTPIGTPANYVVTDATPVYAEVVNGPCSNIAVITYTVNPTPTANDQTPTACSDSDEGNTATVNLTSLDILVNGGNGYTINWFSDAGLTTPIATPTNYTVTDGVAVYAQTVNGPCTNSANITYTVNPTPTANDQTPTVCSDGVEGNTATVDLTTLANAIDGGNGYTINWYSDAGLTTPIGTPANYVVTDGTPVYAEVFNGPCSNVANITYTVNPTPTANDQTPAVCSDGVEGNTATVDLTTLENAIDGGNGYTINWYSDAGLTTPIGTPANYVVTDGTPVYAGVVNGPCTNVANITYTVNPTPTANDQTPAACSDTEEGNTAKVDLTTIENAIDGGNGYTINWFSDAGLTTAIGNPTNYTVTDATPIYAEVVNGPCSNVANITYTVNPLPTANDQSPMACSDVPEGNTATVDLTTLENSIDGGNGYTINWYSDAGLTTAIGDPTNYTVTDATPVYAEVVNGPCANVASTTYSITATPTANDQTPEACSDAPAGNTATVDLTMLNNAINGGNGYTVNWYSDAGLTTPIADPTNYTVTDATPVYAETVNGACTNSANITYTVNPSPDAAVSPDPAEACADVDLVLNGNPSGGSGIYTHAWTGAAIGSLSDPNIVNPTFNNNTAGSYNLTYTVTDDNNCVGSDDITVDVEALPVIDAGMNDTVCYTETVYDIMGATAANESAIEWTFDGNGSFDPIIPQATDNVIDPTYHIDPDDKNRTSISDVTLYMESWGVNGCATESVVDSFKLAIAPELQVSVGAPSPFTIDAATTDIEVTVNISGRNTLSDLSILLISPNDSVVPLSITDAAADGFCNFNDSIGVTFTNDPTPPTIVNYCTGTDITGNFDIVGDWSVLTGEDPANGLWRIRLVDSIDFPSAGGFDGEVIEAAILFGDTNTLGAYTTLQYTLDGTMDINNAPAYLEGGNSFVDMSLGLRTECYNSCDALAEVTVTGGLPPYNLNWRHNGSDSDSLYLCPGSYTIDVTDRLGCVDSTTVEVSAPDTIQYTNVSYNDSLSCAGDSAYLTVELDGGTGQLEWSIDGSTYYNSGDTLFNLTAGNSTIQVRDANNCTPGDSTIFVYEPQAISLDSIQSSHITCFNANDGSVEVFATGGSDSLMYWIPDVDTVYSSTGSGLFTNLAADTFNIYVTDIYNCGPDSMTDVILTQPNTFAIDSLIQVPMVCFGDVAEIGLSVTGGTPVYNYTIDTANIAYSPFAGADTTWFTIDSTHTFRVFVQDSNGCLTISDTIHTIAPSANITIDSLHVEPVIGCFGDDSGSIYLRPQGGVAPYQYRLNDTGSYGAFSDTLLFDNLSAGRDTLWVRDTLGCEVMLVDTLITQPQELFLNSITYFGVSCNNGNDGRITASVTGGTAPYTFRIDGPVQDTIIQSGTSVEFDSLTSGNYDFFVTDTFACKTETDNDVIGNPPLFEIDTVVVDSFQCFGTPATIAMKVSGGNAPYEYSIDGTTYSAFNHGDSTTISIPATDTLALWARDNNSCEIFYDSIELIAPAQTITYDSLRVEPVTGCYGDSNGAIYVNATGGIAPYEYKLGINDAYQDTGWFQNLAIGRDTLFIKDNYGCEVQLLDTLVTGPDSLYIPKPRVQIDPFCNNLDTGFVKLFFAGGTKPYSYWIEGQSDTTMLPFNQDSIQFPLGVGTYNIHGRDANKCKTLDFAPVTITEAQRIQFADTIIEDFTCYNDTAHVTVVLSNGLSPYTYTINGNPGESIDNDTITIDFLPAGGGGIKSIVFSDSDPDNFCDDTLVVNLNNLLPLTIDSVAVNNVACYGENNGNIFIRAIGGQAPYEYKLGEAGTYQSAGLFTGLGPVTDTSVWVRDNLGCETILTDTIDILEPNSLYVVDSVIYAVDTDSGGVKLEVFGGVPRFDYKIADTTGSYTDKILNKPERQHTFDSLPLGVYVYTVTDNNNCTYSDTVTISSVPPLDVEFSLYLENSSTPSDSTTRCWNTALDAEVIINELPGINDDFVVQIYYNTNTDDPPVELTELVNNNYFIGGLGEGLNYKIEVLGLNTSRIWDTTFAVYSPPQMFITTAVDSATCDGDLSNDGSLEVQSVNGGNGGPYTYEWGGIFEAGDTSQVSGLSPGMYGITVTDRKNCAVEASRRVGYNYGYTVSIISPDPPAICDETDNVQLAASVSFDPERGQAGINFNYEWSPESVVDDSSAALTGFDINETTVFTVTTTIDSTCEQTATLEVEVIDVPELTITAEKNGFFETGDTVGVIENGEVLLAAQPFTYNTYNWSSDNLEALDWIDDMEAQSVYINPELSPDEVVMYTLETTYRGCVENDSIWITYVEEIESLPTGFSPNGDGINDRWYIDNAGQYGQIDLIVFNRWGEKIYQFSGVYENSEGWDGTFKGKDLPVGTYFYILQLKEQGNRTIKGTVTIVR